MHMYKPYQNVYAKRKRLIDGYNWEIVNQKIMDDMLAIYWYGLFITPAQIGGIRSTYNVPTAFYHKLFYCRYRY